jgi:hypothetical protein
VFLTHIRYSNSRHVCTVDGMILKFRFSTKMIIIPKPLRAEGGHKHVDGHVVMLMPYTCISLQTRDGSYKRICQFSHEFAHFDLTGPGFRSSL